MKVFWYFGLSCIAIVFFFNFMHPTKLAHYVCSRKLLVLKNDQFLAIFSLPSLPITMNICAILILLS